MVWAKSARTETTTLRRLTLSRCLKLLSKFCWAFLESERCCGRRRVRRQSAAPHTPLTAGCPASHRFALLLQVLEVLGELHAHAGHHILSDELPLAGVVVQFVEDLLERAVVAEPAVEDGRVGEKQRHDSMVCWVSLRDAPIPIPIPASGIAGLAPIPKSVSASASSGSSCWYRYVYRC